MQDLQNRVSHLRTRNLTPGVLYEPHTLRVGDSEMAEMREMLLERARVDAKFVHYTPAYNGPLHFNGMLVEYVEAPSHLELVNG